MTVRSMTTARLEVAAPSGTTQTVTITAESAAGAIPAVHHLQLRPVTDVHGATPSSGVTVGVTATTGAVSLSIDRNRLDVRTDANGVAVLLLDNTGGGGVYTDRLALVLPDGSLVVSAPLAVSNT